MPTQEKWHAAIKVRGNTSQIIGSRGLIAEVYGYKSESDAHLIAAAPELLEALKAVYEAFKDSGLHHSWSIADDLAQTAIAKAEGK